MTDEALTCFTSRQLVRRLSRLAWARAVVEAGFDSLAWVSGLLVTAATAGPAGAHMTRAVLGGVPGIVVVVTGCGLAAGLYRRRYLRGSRDEVRAVIVAGVLAAGGLMGICLAFGGYTAGGRHERVVRGGGDARGPVRELRRAAAAAPARADRGEDHRVRGGGTRAPS